MKKSSFFIFTLILFTSTALAYDGPIDMVQNAFTSTTEQIFTKLEAASWKLLFGLAMLNITIKMVRQLFNQGDLESSLSKFIGSIAWVSICVWLLMPGSSNHNNGSDLIQGFVNWFLNVASLVSGGQGTSFSATDVLNLGLYASNNLITSVAQAATGSVANVVTAVTMPVTSLLAVAMLMLTNIVVLGTCGYIALKVFMVKIETAIVIAVTPISFALLGIDALRDQGMAPLKYTIAVGLRILILGAVVGSITLVTTNLDSVLAAKVAQGGMTDIWTPILAAIFGYVLIAFLAFKSDSIASSLASGSSQMGTADMASAVAAGVAAGAALASGGMAAGSAVAKTGGSMSDFMKSLKNAGGDGNGASDAEKAPNSLTDVAPPPSPFSQSSNSPEKPRDPKADRALVDKLLKGPEPKGGTGESAGISGTSPTASNRTSFVDRMANLNHHVSRESSAVNVSINSHLD